MFDFSEMCYVIFCNIEYDWVLMVNCAFDFLVQSCLIRSCKNTTRSGKSENGSVCFVFFSKLANSSEDTLPNVGRVHETQCRPSMTGQQKQYKCQIKAKQLCSMKMKDKLAVLERCLAKQSNWAFCQGKQ